MEIGSQRFCLPWSGFIFPTSQATQGGGGRGKTRETSRGTLAADEEKKKEQKKRERGGRRRRKGPSAAINSFTSRRTERAYRAFATCHDARGRRGGLNNSAFRRSESRSRRLQFVSSDKTGTESVLGVGYRKGRERTDGEGRLKGPPPPPPSFPCRPRIRM